MQKLQIWVCLNSVFANVMEETRQALQMQHPLRLETVKKWFRFVQLRKILITLGGGGWEPQFSHSPDQIQITWCFPTF